MATKWEKVQVKTSSGLTVTKWKDTSTGKTYFTKPRKGSKSSGRVGVGITKEMREAQKEHGTGLNPYLGLRNTNLLGGPLPKIEKKSKPKPGQYGDYEGGLSFAESLQINPKASTSTLKIGEKKSTEKPIQYSPSGELIPTEADKAGKWNQGVADIYRARQLESENLEQLRERHRLENSIKQDLNKAKNIDREALVEQSKTAADTASDTLTKIQEKQAQLENTTKTNVFTRHYKTGKELGVMTKRQRLAYEKEAGTRTFESEMERYGLDPNDPRRETKYTSKSWKKRADLMIKQKEDAARNELKVNPENNKKTST